MSRYLTFLRPPLALIGGLMLTSGAASVLLMWPLALLIARLKPRQQ